MPSQICFPNHRGLPGQPDPPTIDGFIEPEHFMIEPEFGIAPSQIDTGWTRSSRITYGTDTSVGLGRPLMVFQGIKHKSDDLIYLSFIIRRDTAFDNNDSIILVFHPNYSLGSGSKTGDERRIDIFPITGSVGAGEDGPDDNPENNIRTNRQPRTVEYYNWNMTDDQWEVIENLPDEDKPIKNVDIRVRSWNPGENALNWSVEVQLPTTISKGGDNWIDFTSHFGFYFNCIGISIFPSMLQ